MAEQWYLARNGTTYGPYTSARLKEIAGEGGLYPDDMLTREGMQKWVPANQVKGLFPQPAKPAIPVAIPAVAVAVPAQPAKPAIAVPASVGGRDGGSSGTPTALPAAEPEVEVEADPESPTVSDTPSAFSPTAEAPPPKPAPAEARTALPAVAGPTAATADVFRVMRGGREVGPLSADEIAARLGSGELSAADLVCVELWVPLRFLALAGALGRAAPAAGGTGG